MAIKKHTKTSFSNENGFEFQFEPIENTLTVELAENGFVAKYLTQDNDYGMPDEYDPDVFLVHYHRQFEATNSEIIKDDFIDWMRDEISEEDKKEHYFNGFWIFPVKSYIHSGVHLSLGSGGFACDPGGWDTSHVGAIFVRKNTNWQDETQAMRAAECKIKEWNQALSGEVYCCVREVYTIKKEPIDFDVVCGYYGFEYAKECLQNEF